MKYSTIACGGTFDRLHPGHIAFLEYAFSLGQQVLIGLTTDAYIKTYKKNVGVGSFVIREHDLRAFLLQRHLEDRTTIVPIDTVEGPIVTKDFVVDGLLVTAENMSSAIHINKKRIENGLPKLQIITFPLVLMNGEKISSTKIRSLHKKLVLPQFLRARAAQPLGKMFTGDLSFIKEIPQEKIVTVGDITTKKVHEMGKSPKISVVDFMVERQKTFTALSQLGLSGKEKVYMVKNPAGSISVEAWEIIDQSILHIPENSQSVICVDGEEDLLTLPLVMFLPIGFTLLYGQPQQGMVQVEITSSVKEKVYELLTKFI